MTLSTIGGSILAFAVLEVIATTAAQVAPLRAVSAFSSIPDKGARSVALFEEAAKVITSPRCLNCHPSTRQPTQGDDLHPHLPPMYAGPDGDGVPGMACASCHGPTNTATQMGSIISIPGSPGWKLAPASMAWQGKSLPQICLQLKDPSQNGGRTLSEIQAHIMTDQVVGWAWHPGEGRAPAPGTQAELGALIEAWIVTGAECPAR